MNAFIKYTKYIFWFFYKECWAVNVSDKSHQLYKLCLSYQLYRNQMLKAISCKMHHSQYVLFTQSCTQKNYIFIWCALLKESSTYISGLTTVWYGYATLRVASSPPPKGPRATGGQGYKYYYYCLIAGWTHHIEIQSTMRSWRC